MERAAEWMEPDMPRPTPIPIRKVVFARMQRGQSAGQIAVELGLSQRTVEKLLIRFRQRGEAGIVPDQPPSGGGVPRSKEMVEAAVAMRRQHPSWGSGLIAVKLSERFVGQAIPNERTVRRWLKKAGLQPVRGVRPPRRSDVRDPTPHGTWQMDAAEKMDLANGCQASWLRVVDEATGAVLGTRIFPPREFHPSSTD